MSKVEIQCIFVLVICLALTSLFKNRILIECCIVMGISGPSGLPHAWGIVCARPQIGEFGRKRRHAKNLTADIWVIFRELNFPANNDIGGNSHVWMGTIWCPSKNGCANRSFGHLWMGML